MPIAAFKKMNQEREQKGLSVFANPRNATAGTVRQLEPSITAQRRLDYFTYMLLKDGRTCFDRHWETLNALDAAGFKVNQTRKLAKTFDQIWAFIEQEEPKRETLPYEIDGIVIKVDRTALQAGTGLHRQSAALGHRLQIRRARGHHENRRHPGASRDAPGNSRRWRR